MIDIYIYIIPHRKDEPAEDASLGYFVNVGGGDHEHGQSITSIHV